MRLFFILGVGKDGGTIFQNRPLSAPRAIAVDNNTVILQSTSATSVHQSKPSTVIVQAPPSSSSLSQSTSGTIQVTSVPTSTIHPQIIGIVTSTTPSIGNIITTSNPIISSSSNTVISRVYGTDGSTQIITTAPSTMTHFLPATSGTLPPGMVVQQSPSHQLPLTVVPSNMVLKRPAGDLTTNRPTTVMIAVTSTANNNSNPLGQSISMSSESKKIKLETPNIQIVQTTVGSSTHPSSVPSSTPSVPSSTTGVATSTSNTLAGQVSETSTLQQSVPVSTSVPSSATEPSIRNETQPELTTDTKAVESGQGDVK